MLCLPPPLKAPWDRMGHEAPELDHIAIPKVSPHTAAIDQVLPTPRPLKTTKNPAADRSPLTQKRMLLAMTSMQRFGGGDAEVLSDGQVASDGDEGLGCSPMQNTLSGVSHIFGTHKETDVESDHKEKTPPLWQKWHQPSPKEETSPSSLRSHLPVRKSS